MLAGQTVDYWTQAEVVDCRARTVRLGDMAAFAADGRRLAADVGTDPATPVRPGSIAATEADDVCGRGPSLPQARPGDLRALLQDFRTGSVLPGVRVGPSTSG